MGNGIALQYQYDGFGRVLQLTLPDESGIRYRYSPLCLETVERLDAQGTRQYGHTYTDFDLTGHSGRSVLVGSAGEVIFTKDLMGRPLKMTSAYVKEIISPEGYDAVGNLLEKQLKDPMGTTNCRYGYDSLYQLTNESGVADHRYRYDSLNNRLEKDTDSYQVNALNELQQAGSTNYRYDARGCRISENGGARNVTYRYDALNRLVQVETADQRLTYTYDSFNRRITATTSTRGWTSWTETRRDFLYVGQDEIGAIDGTGKLVELRLLGTGHGAEIGATVAIEIAGTVYATLSDSSGNIIALLNASNGTFAEGYRYSAFGEVTIYDNAWWPFKGTRTHNPWQFSSKRIDLDTGFVYFGRRYYDPTLGRWITPDPLGYKAGPNLYAYVMNNPLTHFDLYGLYTDTRNWRCYASLHTLGLDQRCIGPMYRRMGIRPTIQVGFAPTRENRRWRETHPHIVVRPGPRLRNREVGMCNGQKTKLESFYDSMDLVSKAHGGCEVRGLYNPPKGGIGVMDTLMSAILKSGGDTPAVFEQGAEWTESVYRQGPRGKYMHSPHSQGGIIATRASYYVDDYVYNKVHVTAYGPGSIVPEGRFGSARNIISNRDWVSLGACFIDCTRAKMGFISNVEFVKGSGWCDHAILGKTYSSQMMKHGLQTVKNALGEDDF